LAADPSAKGPRFASESLDPDTPYSASQDWLARPPKGPRFASESLDPDTPYSASQDWPARLPKGPRFASESLDPDTPYSASQDWPYTAVTCKPLNEMSKIRCILPMTSGANLPRQY